MPPPCASIHSTRSDIDPAWSDSVSDDDRRIDPNISCSACDAVCCRLTVVVMPDDVVPRHLVERTNQGLDVMARDEEGWCVAQDPSHHGCTIYATRPLLCRKFAMGGPYCVEVREDYADRRARGIPLVMY